MAPMYRGCEATFTNVNALRLLLPISPYCARPLFPTAQERRIIMEVDKVIEKAVLLLNLSQNNPSEHEAQSAFLKCQKLLAQHNLDMSALQSAMQVAVEVGEEKVHTVTKRIDWIESLLWTICKNFRCRWFMRTAHEIIVQKEFPSPWTKSGFNEYLETFTHYTVYGLPTDKAMAVVVFHAAMYAIGVLSKSHKGQIAKRSYSLGFTYGLNAKFDQQRRQMAPGLSLMLVEPEEVKKHQEKFVTGVAESIKANYDFGQSYNSGYQDGKVWEPNLVHA